MPKIARGFGTGASSVTSASLWTGPSAAERSPLARRSRTVPFANATISSPRTSPATGSDCPAGRNVAKRTAGILVVLTPAAVQEQDHEDRHAVDDVAPVLRHVLRLQDADQRDQRDRAGDDAEIVTAPTEDPDAADHDRGDRLEQVRIAHAERGLAAVADEHDARERREQAAEHVQRDGHDPDVDSGQERGPRVVAGRVDPPAERGPRQYERHEHDDAEPQEQVGR